MAGRRWPGGVCKSAKRECPRPSSWTASWSPMASAGCKEAWRGRAKRVHTRTSPSAHGAPRQRPGVAVPGMILISSFESQLRARPCRPRFSDINSVVEGDQGSGKDDRAEAQSELAVAGGGHVRKRGQQRPQGAGDNDRDLREGRGAGVDTWQPQCRRKAERTRRPDDGEASELAWGPHGRDLNPAARAPRSALRDQCRALRQPPDGPEPGPRCPVTSALPTRGLVQPHPGPGPGPASRSRACPAGTPAMRRPQRDGRRRRWKGGCVGENLPRAGASARSGGCATAPRTRRLQRGTFLAAPEVRGLGDAGQG